MPPRKRLGQLLTELGVIDEHQLQSALGHQKQWGGKLGAILVQKGFCVEDDLVSALAKHLGMQRVRLPEAKVDARALKCVSKQIAEKLHVLPYEISGSGRSEVVTIAMSDPTDLSAVDQLAFHTGKRIKPMLAGDAEIVAAILAHYGGGEEKKEPTDKVARPAPPQGVPAVQGTPAGSVAGFPRRIEPSAAAAPAAARAAPYIPPPIPAAKPAALAQKLEEIEPDEAMAAPAGVPPPVVPPPLDLPEDDGQEFGLEPIAAHSQFGDAVSGQEEVAGQGAAGDEVEGLISASVTHHGAAEARQMDGLDAVAAPDSANPDAGQGWTGPILASPEGATASDNGWGKAGEGQTGWDVVAPVPEGGWGTEPAAEASGGWTGPLESWGSAPPESPSAVPGWSSPDPANERDAPGEALPPDAILGTAPILGPADHGTDAPQSDRGPDTAAGSLAWEASAPETVASEPPVFVDDATVPEQAHEAEAPDAWASSEDPLAAHASVGDPLESPASPPDPLATEGAFEDPLAPPESVEATAFAAAADESRTPGEDSHVFPDGHGSTNEFANPAAIPGEESVLAEAGTSSAAVDAPAEETEAPESWRDATDRIEAPPVADPGPADDSQAAFAADGVESWVAPSGDADPAGSGWIGESLEGATPLSPADLGTLASIGVEPSDGVGALRLLAVLIRILNRNQLIEPGDLREEIRESRVQGAAAAVAQAPNGAESETASPVDPGGPAETAET
jgi:hypothetical protein